MAALKQYVLMKNRIAFKIWVSLFFPPIIFDGTWGREACCMQEGMLYMWCLWVRQHHGNGMWKTVLSCFSFFQLPVCLYSLFLPSFFLFCFCFFFLFPSFFLSYFLNKLLGKSAWFILAIIPEGQELIALIITRGSYGEI